MPKGSGAISCVDKRRENPPFGYSKECRFTLQQQIALVAEFHVNKIKPSRIAYRLGVDIARVEAWLAGELDKTVFFEQVKRYRLKKYRAQIAQADVLRGQVAYENRMMAESDFLAEHPSEN